MAVRLSIPQKPQRFELRSHQKMLLHNIMISIAVAIFLIYSYSISQDRLFLGTADPASRFITAMEYARDPGKSLNLEAWLDVWPPVPFIIQGLILRMVLSPSMSDTRNGIMAVQLVGVLLALSGFYFIGQSVALQTDEFTGLLAFILCFRATILMYLIHTTLSEVYAFFFVSLAIWNLFRFIIQNKGFGWSVLFFILAFFCRNETLIVAYIAGVFLLTHGRWLPGALLIGAMTSIASSKLLGSLLVVKGVKFFEFSKHYGWGHTWQDRLNILGTLVYQFWSYNSTFILLLGVCALPLAYYIIKFRNLSKTVCIEDKQDEIKRKSFSNIKKIGSFAWLTKTYDQIYLWVVYTPITFWVVSFLITVGILIQQVLQGNINAQWRYFYLANVFMTTVIALLVAQAVYIIRAKGARLERWVLFGIISILVLSSLWSGFSHATGRKVPWTMPAPMRDVIYFIREHSIPGDRISFDFLLWQESAMAVYLLDPSQFSELADDPELIALVPTHYQFSSERWIAYEHAFIHVKHPRFLVLASDQLWQEIQGRQQNEKDIGDDVPINEIRGYLTPVKGTVSEFIFQSPYVFPKVQIRFTEVYENNTFVVMEYNGLATN